jgi:hypothetical protein
MPLMHSLKDNDLLKLGTSFVNLRVRDFSDLTGRSEHAIRHRLVKLCIEHKTRFGEKRGEMKRGLGYFYWLPNPANPFEKVYFPTQKGWDEALRLGLIAREVNANREKSEGQLDHDLILTDFHKALHSVFKEKLHWSQLYADRFKRWGKKPHEYVNADAFFYIEKDDRKYAAFFVEIENQKGVEEPLRKMRGYAQFAEGGYQELTGHDDFRVILLKPSPAMVTHVLEAARTEKELNTRRFWFADYDTANRYCGAQVWRTPRDVPESISYSLLEA